MGVGSGYVSRRRAEGRAGLERRFGDRALFLGMVLNRELEFGKYRIYMYFEIFL